jgi:hypothetical protein
LTLKIPAGQTSQTITVSVVGDALDEIDETFLVVLSSATNALISDNQGVCSIVDDDLAPTLSISDVTVTEGNSKIGGKATFTVSLSEVSGLPVTVNYASANNTAEGSKDFLNKSGTLYFGPGTLSIVLTYQVIGDKLDEQDETFFINLTKPVFVTLVDTQGECTILDDDLPPTLSITGKTVKEGTGSIVNAVFTVKLLTAGVLSASGQTVTVDYATSDDTATAPADYTSASGTLTFSPGQKSKTITVQVIGDALDENNETFFLNLTNPINAPLAVGQALGTITDNDATPKLSINSVTVTEGAGTVDMVFTVTLSAASGLIVTANYDTANTSAIDGVDYIGVNGSLSFNPGGALTQTITVSILGDSVKELKKTFLLNLRNALNTVFAKGIGTILDDD